MDKHLRFQIYKNQAFNHLLGKEFNDILQSFQNQFKMSSDKAISEIKNHEFSSYITMNRDENICLTLKVLDYLFCDSDYHNIYDRFSKLFNFPTVTDAKLFLDSFPDFDDLKLSNQMDELAKEYAEFSNVRRITYHHFIDDRSNGRSNLIPNSTTNSTANSTANSINDTSYKPLTWQSQKDTEMADPSTILSILKPSDHRDLLRQETDLQCTMKFSFTKHLLKLILITYHLISHDHCQDVGKCSYITMQKILVSDAFPKSGKQLKVSEL